MFHNWQITVILLFIFFSLSENLNITSKWRMSQNRAASPNLERKVSSSSAMSATRKVQEMSLASIGMSMSLTIGTPVRRAHCPSPAELAEFRLPTNVPSPKDQKVSSTIYYAKSYYFVPQYVGIITLPCQPFVAWSPRHGCLVVGRVRKLPVMQSLRNYLRNYA